MDTIVNSVSLYNNGGSVSDVPGWFKGLYVLSGAGAGYAKIRDGGASGNVIFDLITPASAVVPLKVELPGRGIRFETNLYVDLSGITYATVTFDGAVDEVLRLANGEYFHLATGGLLELGSS